MKIKQSYIYPVILLAILIFAAAVQSPAQTHAKVAKQKVQTATVLITEQGYSPASVRLRRGVPARLTFLRKTDRTCGTEIVIPAYGVNRVLPLNEPVVIRFTPKKTGEFGFTCGMNMMRGKVIVR